MLNSHRIRGKILDLFIRLVNTHTHTEITTHRYQHIHTQQNLSLSLSVCVSLPQSMSLSPLPLLEHSQKIAKHKNSNREPQLRQIHQCIEMISRVCDSSVSSFLSFFYNPPYLKRKDQLSKGRRRRKKREKKSPCRRDYIEFYFLFCVLHPFFSVYNTRLNYVFLPSFTIVSLCFICFVCLLKLKIALFHV